jgi:hypothetical protein
VTWSDAVGHLNESVLAAFGRPVAFVGGGVETTVTAVFDAPQRAGQSPTEHAFLRPDYRLTAKRADIAATGAKAGDAVVVDGRTYFIADLIDDGDDMTEVVIRPG